MASWLRRRAFLGFLFWQTRIITRTSRAIWNKEAFVNTTKRQQAEEKDLQGKVEDVETSFFVKPHGFSRRSWWSPVNTSFEAGDENTHAGGQRYDDDFGAHFSLSEGLFLCGSREDDCRGEVKKRKTGEHEQVGRGCQQHVAAGLLRIWVQGVD